MWLLDEISFKGCDAIYSCVDELPKWPTYERDRSKYIKNMYLDMGGNLYLYNKRYNVIIW